MFFLISYGLLNTSAALESFANPPSWRPTFKTHWIISFAGALGCAAAMFMINAGATFVASFCVILIFLVMQRRRMQVGWGDIRSGVMTLLARYALLIVPISYPMMYIVMNASAVGNGMAHTLPALMFSMGRLIVIFVPFAWGLSAVLGMAGVFVAMSVSSVVVCFMATRYMENYIRRVAT